MFFCSNVTVNECLSDYVKTVVGCIMPWQTADTAYPPCATDRQLEHYLNLTKALANMDELGVTFKTGCKDVCTRKEFRASTEISDNSKPGRHNNQVHTSI